MFCYALSHRAQSTIEHITSRDSRFGQPSFPVGGNWFVGSLGRDAGHNSWAIISFGLRHGSFWRTFYVRPVSIRFDLICSAEGLTMSN